MTSYQNMVVLVTGAGSGIGRDTAKLFAEKHAKVLLVDLNQQAVEETCKMIETAGYYAESYSCDVADACAMRALAEQIHRKYSALDVLVNNAGISATGSFLDAQLATWKKVMDVNLMGVVHGCYYFIPKMIEHDKAGAVINVASVAGYFAPKDMPVYSASKHAVMGFSESLRQDLVDRNISVSVICPGIIDTPIHKTATFEGSTEVAAKSREINIKRHARRRFPAKLVAEQIVKSARQGKGVVPVSPEAWFIYYAKRWFPGAIATLERRRGIAK